MIPYYFFTWDRVVIYAEDTNLLKLSRKNEAKEDESDAFGRQAI